MLSQHFCVFLCAAENGSFNKAAEKLLISPTAVMKHVNSLESELELRLFERRARGLTLTEAGNILYNRGLAIQKATAQALSEARQVANKWQYTVTVGTSLLNPCKVFMDLWAQINWQCPQLKLNVVPFDDNHSDILSVIDSIGKKLDFLVGVCDAKQWLERCQMLTLGSYKKCIAMPFTHRLAKKKKLNLTDLHGETLMMVKEGNSPINDKLRADLQKNHPQIMIEDLPHYYDISVFNRCAQTGHLLLNLECWADVHPALVTLPVVDWSYAIPYGILYAKEPSPEVSFLVNCFHKLKL